MRHCINRIRHVIEQFILKLHYNHLLTLLLQGDCKVYLKTLIGAIVVGTIINYSTSDRLPLFWLFIVGFSIALSMTFYSVRMLHAKMNNFETDACGEPSLIHAKAKYKHQYKANYNWILTLIIPTVVVLIIQHLITIRLSPLLKIYCYGALFIIVGLSVIAYVQYVHFIKFVLSISKIRVDIQTYDHITPYKSSWIISLSKTANKESNLFFIVGFVYIILFYVISFSGFYGIANFGFLDNILLGGLWMGAIIGIAFMFPVLTVISLFGIKKIIKKINQQQEVKLRSICALTSREPMLSNTHQLILFEFLSLPTYPCKPLLSYAVSYIIAAINFGASLQACYSMIQIVQPKV